MKHTPGKVIAIHEHAGEEWAHNLSMVTDIEKHSISCSPDVEVKYVPLQTAYFAPELLDALRGLVDANPNDSTWNYPAAWDNAKRVIKKATE